MTLRNRVLRLFSAAIGDQMLLSGANFLVGLLLVRYTSSADYGMYVLLQTSLLLILSIHGALVCNPLSILSGGRAPPERQRMIGAIQRGQSRLLRPLLLLPLIVPAAGYLAGLFSPAMALFIGLAILAAWTSVQRNYIRSVLLIYARTRTLLAGDAVYVGVLLAGMGWATLSRASAPVWIAFALMSAAWAGSAWGMRRFAADPGWVAGDARAAWREMRSLGVWALTGSVIYWVFSRSYNYILVSRMDLSAVAAVNAVRLMVMPAIMLAVGLQSVLTPLAAAWKAEVGLQRLVRRLWRILLAVGALDLLYFALLWPFRDWVSTRVLHKHITERDTLLLLWAVFALVALARDVLAPAVYALGRLKWLAWQIAFCALIALAVMWFGIPRWGMPAALIALLLGESLNLLGILYLIRDAQRQARRDEPIGALAAAPTGKRDGKYGVRAPDQPC